MKRLNIMTACRIWLLCIVTYGFFSTVDNPNVISRAALTLSIIERHELTIDPLARFTIDKAFVNDS